MPSDYGPVVHDYQMSPALKRFLIYMVNRRYNDSAGDLSFHGRRFRIMYTPRGMRPTRHTTSRMGLLWEDTDMLAAMKGAAVRQLSKRLAGDEDSRFRVFLFTSNAEMRRWWDRVLEELT